MQEVILSCGEAMCEFNLPCDIKTPGVCIASAGNSKTGCVTLFPEYKQLQVCKACLDDKLSKKEWSIKR